MSMPLIEEIYALETKLALIDRPDWGPMQRPSSGPVRTYVKRLRQRLSDDPGNPA